MHQAPPKFELKSNVGVCGTTGGQEGMHYTIWPLCWLFDKACSECVLGSNGPAGQLQFVPNKGEMSQACIWHSASEFKSC